MRKHHTMGRLAAVAIGLGLTTAMIAGAAGAAMAADMTPYQDQRAIPDQLTSWMPGAGTVSAQPFVPQTTGLASSMTIWSFQQNGANIVDPEIHTMDASNNVSADPIPNGTGTATVSSTPDPSLPMSGSEDFYPVTITFPNAPELTAGSSYVLTFTSQAGDRSYALGLSWFGGDPATYMQYRDAAKPDWAGNSGVIWFDLNMTALPDAVVATAPSLTKSTVCGVESTISMPQVDGVTYSQTRAGSSVTVTATADTGYVLDAASESSWTFDVTADPCPTTVTAVAPSLTKSTTCDVESTISTPQVVGVTYAQTRAGSTVTVTATADSGYVLDAASESSWTFDVTADACSTPPPTKPTTPTKHTTPTTPTTPAAPTTVTAGTHVETSALAVTGGTSPLPVMLASGVLLLAGATALVIRRRRATSEAG